ncbi:solute carrier family 15 member 1-like isoform X2 [Corticium candelabrum]|uniref:solute carrier family 15 member 1-like isoform X2 n=1 Tax=Corticium candelabrum TaxID=121492 RepID=UPI002E2FFC2D|nr:solute carrier family 15 member 1-like isoform X2 [Corticium candelabrum]
MLTRRTMDARRSLMSDQEEQAGQAGSASKRKYPWKAMAFLMAAAATQSYASSGLQAVLELYFTTFLLKSTLPSSSNLRISKLASTSFNIWVGIMDMASLSAGFLADLVLGNCKTQIISNFLNCAGVSLLMFSTWQLLASSQETGPTTHPDLNMNSTSTTNGALDLTLASIGLLSLAIGYGQLSAIQSVFVGDQFSDTQQEAKLHSFSWYYLFLNVGSLLSESGAPILRQTFNFLICYSTVAGTVFLSTVCFFLGLPSYRKVALVKKEDREDTIDESESLLGGTNRCALDKCTQDESTRSRWCKIMSTLRELQGIVKVFTPLIVYWMLFYQQNSTWVLQGGRMNCYFGNLHVPPDLMPSFNDVLVICLIPLLDYLIYPHIERVMGFKVMPLHKIGSGMVCAALAFVLAGLLELYIVVPEVDCRGGVSLAWQVPQYILISFAEVLVAISGLEFAYSQAPDNLSFDVTFDCCISCLEPELQIQNMKMKLS